jgi:MYXO-CTERM domain-containing protein
MKASRWILTAAVSAVCVAPLHAQDPWDYFTGTTCAVVNTENAELIVRRATGELVIVRGADKVLSGSFVDEQGNVYLGDTIYGFIAVADDADGRATLWWLTLTDNVVHLDTLTGDPLETDLFPADFADVPCDPCGFWDDQSICVEPEPPPAPPQVRINICGSAGSATMALTLAGLTGIGWSRRRWH